MGKYVYSRRNVAMVTTDDLMTYIGAASRRARLRWVEVSGMGTTSIAGVLRISRSTGGTTGGGALTPQKASSDHPAAGGTVNTTWTGQPTLDSGTPIGLGVNANGAINRWAARAELGETFEIRGTEQISIRPEVGTHNVNVAMCIEEDY